MIKKITIFFKKYRIESIILALSLIFSSWLMFSTFSYHQGNMLIATKAWSDFASAIPLIRSFSFGNNFPPQYPLFSGPPIKYHFIFFALVGLLEKSGLRIDYALNLPSVGGFALLMLMIYVFAKLIFKSRAVGILSIVFFIFNGSLDFIKFFTLFPLSPSTISEITANQKFISFGPYDNSVISAFWNLNIYTNQRHLAVSYALSMILILILIKPYLNNRKPNLRIGLFIGIVFGLSFFLNIAVFLMTGIIFAIMFIFARNNRKNILVSIVTGGLIAIPQYLYMQQGVSSSQISIYLGYLANSGLTAFSFLNYWFQNLGIHLILIPLGFILAPKKAKQIFIAFFALFLVGNLFKFSPEVAANHKFFNYFMIVGAMFSAYFIVYFWNKKAYLKPLSLILFFLLILSGIIDFFPIYNDSKIALADYPISPDVAWIMQNTKPDSVFLNTQYLYDNASLAGRKIFLGWPYFSWSQGYDTNLRGDLLKQLLGSQDKKTLCVMLKNNNINYIEISGNNLNDPNLPRVSVLLQYGLTPIYQNFQSNYKIYSVKNNCRNI